MSKDEALRDLIERVDNTRAGIVPAGPSGIYDYARGIGKAPMGVGPDDFQMTCAGDSIYMSFTLSTTQEAEAIREIIRLLAARTLKSHRAMVHYDIHDAPPPPPPDAFKINIEKMFGATTEAPSRA